MPEQLTKHPEVTLQVLQSAGAQCGAGAKQDILTACPPARFCKLPGGEICVYGLSQAKQMTQIGAADWTALVSPAVVAPAALGAGLGAALLLAGVAAGVVLARLLRARR